MANLTVPEEVQSALAEVRSDKSKFNFAVVGFDDSDPKSKTLALFGTGNDGVDGLKTYIKPDDVNYCLLRIDFNYETVGVIKADTTRFMFIYLRPENVPLKRKMVLGSVEGQVKKLFSPFIRTYETDNVDDISTEKIAEIIDTITMTKNKVTDKKADSSLFIDGRMVSQRNDATDKSKAMLSPDSRAKFGSFSTAKGADVTFDDEELLKSSIKSVRDDSSEVRWCLFSYKDKKTIEFTASGNGDVSEMLENCTDDKISYGLFRFTESYGKNINQVKFGFVTWLPENISPITKALVSTHKGEVINKFHPFHLQFTISSKTELTEEIAMNAMASVTGTKSHVTDKKAEAKVEHYERKMLGGATKAVQELNFTNKEDLLQAISDLRKADNQDGNNVVVAKFVSNGEGKKTWSLEFMGTSVDFVDEDSVNYILVKSKKLVDGYEVSRFVLLRLEGKEVPLTAKGAIGVFHGAVKDVFGSVHSNADVSSKDEINNYM